MSQIVGTMAFKKFSGEKLENVSKYVNAYIKEHKLDNIEIIIGTDSQNKGSNTVYSTLIVLSIPGHGGRCILTRWRTTEERARQVRTL